MISNTIYCAKIAYLEIIGAKNKLSTLESSELYLSNRSITYEKNSNKDSKNKI